MQDHACCLLKLRLVASVHFRRTLHHSSIHCTESKAEGPDLMRLKICCHWICLGFGSGSLHRRQVSRYRGIGHMHRLKPLRQRLPRFLGLVGVRPSQHVPCEKSEQGTDAMSTLDAKATENPQQISGDLCCRCEGVREGLLATCGPNWYTRLVDTNIVAGRAMHTNAVGFERCAQHAKACVQEHPTNGIGIASGHMMSALSPQCLRLILLADTYTGNMDGACCL